MPIVTYEMLVQEEKNRQIAMAVLAGVSAAGNSIVLRGPAMEPTQPPAAGPAPTIAPLQMRSLKEMQQRKTML